MPEDSQAKPAPLPDDPALSALKRMARPQPKAFEAPAPAAAEVPGAVGSGSATGFVGSLAKPAGPLPGDTMVGGTVRKGDPIQMAREVPPKRPATPLAEIAKAAEEAEAATSEAPVPPKDSPVVPESSAAMAYVMMTIAVVLLVIGAWAVGALMYMRSFQPLSPRDVTYPLIAWEISVEKGFGAYTRSSVAMAWAMLLCLPVSVVLLVMGWKLLPRRSAVAAA